MSIKHPHMAKIDLRWKRNDLDLNYAFRQLIMKKQNVAFILFFIIFQQDLFNLRKLISFILSKI